MSRDVETIGTVARWWEHRAQTFYDDLVKSRSSGFDGVDEPDTSYAFAYHLFNVGKYEEALSVFSGLTKAFPDEGYLWRGLGIAFQQLGRYDEAIEAYDSAIARDTAVGADDVVSRVYQAESFVLSGDPAEGQRRLEQVAAIDEPAPEDEPGVQRARLLLRVLREQPDSSDDE